MGEPFRFLALFLASDFGDMLLGDGLDVGDIRMADAVAAIDASIDSDDDMDVSTHTGLLLLLFELSFASVGCLLVLLLVPLVVLVAFVPFGVAVLNLTHSLDMPISMHFLKRQCCHR
mgnify:CR=1 FL=1